MLRAIGAVPDSSVSNRRRSKTQLLCMSNQPASEKSVRHTNARPSPELVQRPRYFGFFEERLGACALVIAACIPKPIGRSCASNALLHLSFPSWMRDTSKIARGFASTQRGFLV